MTRQHTSSLLLLAAAVLALAGCTTQWAGIPNRIEPPKAVPVVEPKPGAAVPKWSGVAAIVPSANAPITQAQVRDYALTHRLPLALTAADRSVLSVDFLSSAKMGVLLDTPFPGMRGDEPTCLVVMSGRFVFAGPPGATPAFSVAFEVFDVRTGNMLQAGGLLNPPRKPDAKP